MKPRPYTKQEVRKELVEHFIALADYWSGVEPTGPHNATEKARMLGLVHSILVTFDGASASLPAFNISAAPDPSDEEYCKKRGENWYKANEVINDDVTLHDLMWRLECDSQK